MSRKLFFILQLAILVFIVFINFTSLGASGDIEIIINNKKYSFEVAATPAQRSQGLMFRKKLPQDSGMFFIFQKPKHLSFYMENTPIPLDLAFIDGNFKIIGIESMKPFDHTRIVSSKKAQYALEANRGFFQRIGLRVGDIIEPLGIKEYLK